MKFAVQEGLLPGQTIAEKFALAKKIGFEGVEVWGQNLAGRVDEIQKAIQKTKMPVSTICAGMRGYLLAADPAERKTAMDDTEKLLAIAGNLGCVGLIVVPIFYGPQISNASPWKTAEEIETELFIKQLKQLGPVAKKHKTNILVESLNRYETHFLKTQKQSFDICERVGHPNIRLMSDFFHMHIEETNPPAALRNVAKHLRHVHLADSTRMQPGTGTLDFAANFAALKEIGYKGFAALECGLIGKDMEKALAKSLQFMKSCL